MPSKPPSTSLIRICITPRVEGLGGMASFRYKLTDGLEARGIQVTNDLKDTPYDAVLVIGGTRNLLGLWRAKRRGIPVVQRLNGMNWIHRQRKTGLRHYLRAEYGNRILSTIRARIATGIVYQSDFAKEWWQRQYGPTPVPHQVVMNAVDLDTYSSTGTHQRPTESDRILLVEGNLGGGYELGLENAVHLVEAIATQRKHPLELMVVGQVSDKLIAHWSARSKVPIVWAGAVPRAAIPEIDRSAHLLFSADLNAACPNSVIEALACGLPVLSFDTGALPEMVSGQAGRIVPYGGDPWQLDPPDILALTDAALEILNKQTECRPAARDLAERQFGLDQMVDQYLDALLKN